MLSTWRRGSHFEYAKARIICAIKMSWFLLSKCVVVLNQNVVIFIEMKRFIEVNLNHNYKYMNVHHQNFVVFIIKMCRGFDVKICHGFYYQNLSWFYWQNVVVLMSKFVVVLMSKCVVLFMSKFVVVLVSKFVVVLVSKFRGFESKCRGFESRCRGFDVKMSWF